MNKKQPYEILSSSTLKLIAMVTMFIDHFGYTIVYWSPYSANWYQTCRNIGRLAFPIYCFLLIEGFIHTSNRTKYALRLFLFALLSEIPFDMVFRNVSIGHIEFTYQNVMFTLLIGLLTIWGMEVLSQKSPVLQLLPIVLGLAAGYFGKTDYSWKGVLLIIVLYFFRYYKVTQTIVGCVCLYWEWIACFAFIPIRMYNGKKGWMTGAAGRYLPYLFYPAHLLLLALMRHFFFIIQFPFL